MTRSQVHRGHSSWKAASLERPLWDLHSSHEIVTAYIILEGSFGIFRNFLGLANFLYFLGVREHPSRCEHFQSRGSSYTRDSNMETGTSGLLKSQEKSECWPFTVNPRPGDHSNCWRKIPSLMFPSGRSGKERTRWETHWGPSVLNKMCLQGRPVNLLTSWYFTRT